MADKRTTGTYVIACTLRTGSNLLCADLHANGYGDPAEHIQRGTEGLEQARLRAENGTGWLGLKLPWEHHADSGMIDPLPGAAWIRLRRHDVAAQAVSLWRARTTGAWTSETASTRPRFDVAAAARLAARLQAQDDLWGAWLAGRRPDPFIEVFYEDYVTDRTATVAAVIATITQALPPDLVHLSTHLHAQSDDWSTAAADELRTVLPDSVCGL